MFSAFRSILRESGFRKSRLLSAIRAWPGYVAERRMFREALGDTADDFSWGNELPILTEKNEASGGLGAYLLQDLTVARWIREDAPTKHFDVGSRIDGFVCNVAAFREIEVIDIRPAPGEIPGVAFHQCDIMGKCPPEWENSMPSLSCLHTIEHFGLGRYGDPIDPLGHEKGIARLKAMVMPGGLLYLSTPIGTQRIEFNAHRIFAATTLFGWFAEGWKIERFAVIDDDTKLHGNVSPTDQGIAKNFGCECGVGIMAGRKISNPDPR
jgi:hypothetical protein